MPVTKRTFGRSTLEPTVQPGPKPGDRVRDLTDSHSGPDDDQDRHCAEGRSGVLDLCHSNKTAAPPPTPATGSSTTNSPASSTARSPSATSSATKPGHPQRASVLAGMQEDVNQTRG